VGSDDVAEAALVKQVARGDRDAFVTLLRMHQGPLQAFALRLLGDPAQAEDVVQETLLRLWSRAGSFRPENARLTTWLHNIAHNLCVDRFRTAARTTFIEEPGELRDEGEGDPEAGEAGRRRDNRVRRALAALPERQRSALLLCHYQGLSNRDAAVVLDVSIDALESLLARGRRSLRQQLGEAYER
jgi:RNA polymerase sigma-70 factor (ECF subfamily)